MKKLLLAFVYFLLLQAPLNASHLMGGQITASNISGLNYDVIMTLYRDTTGIPIALQDHILVYTSAGANIADLLANTTFPVNYGNGVEEYVYTINYTFPSTGDYILSWWNCCRNASILNIPNASGTGMFLSTQVHVDFANSTPVFLNPPIPIAQVNVPFFYNPLPFDIDADSLLWSLDIPFDNFNLNANPASAIAIAGYSLPSSDISMPFTMNTVTGEISFLPNTLGNFVVSVIAQEWRNGVMIGYIRRDMQIIVIPSTNIPPVFYSNSNISILPDNCYHIPPNTNFTLSLSVVDPDNNFITTTANGEVFNIANPALFSHSDGTGSAFASFSWTPDASLIRDHPYLAALRTAEHSGSTIFYIDHTYALKVIGPTGVAENAASNQFYFNVIHDGTGQILLDINMPASAAVNIKLRNLAGQVVQLLHNNKMNAGKNLIIFNRANLDNGLYLISVENESSSVITRKMEILK
jgi:hypothetical protein